MNNRHASPPLLEDEWVLLLDVYLSHRSGSVPSAHPAIVNASEILVDLAKKAGRKTPPNFRLPAGIRRQMTTFKHLDNSMTTSGRKVAETAAVVWGRFGHDPARCRNAADAVRAKVRG